MTHHFRLIRREILVIIAFTIALAALLLPEPKATQNSGSREVLADALREIGRSLMSPGELERSAAWQDVSVSWYHQVDYQKILFRPVALSPKLTLTPSAAAAPTPLVVMVPVEPADAKRSPILSAGEPATLGERQKRQREQIKKCFAAHGIEDAALLLSDGSIEHRLVNGGW